jgi:hypothetical protein
MIPYALKAGDIAGAVEVVVQDGTVLLQGYGYADVTRSSDAPQANDGADQVDLKTVHLDGGHAIGREGKRSRPGY